MKKLFPVLLDLKNKPCLVIGGGKVALRKILALKECGARVQVVSPDAEPRIREMAAQKMLTWTRRAYAPTYLEGVILVICATDDYKLNDRVARHCAERGILVNAVDSRDQSSFLMPAVMRRGDLTIAVSTNGTSPAFAVKLCRQFQEEFGPEYQTLLARLGDLREEIIAKIPDPERRRSVFASLVDSELLELIRVGDERKLKERIDQCIFSQ